VHSTACADDIKGVAPARQRDRARLLTRLMTDRFCRDTAKNLSISRVIQVLLPMSESRGKV
jgi:hypothetical protein